MALDTYCTGFEPRFLGAVGNVGNRLFSSITGTPTINTTVPANGAACLEISASAASEAVALDTNLIGASKNRVRVVFRIRLEDLPAADCILASFTAAANVEFRWHQSTGKFSVEYEGGTETDGPSVSADTWYHIEIYADMATGGAKTIDWWVDGAAQTQHTSAGGADTAATWEWGCSFQAQTLTAQYDDTVIWTDTAAISGPKGPHKVVLLSVDTGGTVSTIGVTTDFQTFAGATPTLTAWNATTARGNIDEIPVNTTSAQDGIAQITANTANAVNVPMTSYTLAGAEAVAALRVCACGWQQTTTSCTIGLRTFNGTTETILLAAQAHTVLGNNTATPGWICRMATLADFDTQGEIDALVVRVGFSGDATPDIGFHAVYAELAVKEVTSAQVDVDGSRAVTATSSGTLAVDRVVAGDRPITATVAGTLAADRPVSGSLAVTATIAGTIDVGAPAVEIDGSRPVTATIAGTLAVDRTVSGSLAVTAGRVGTLAVDRTVSGSVVTTAGRTGTLAVDRTVDGTRPTTMTIAGTIDVVQPGQVNVDGARPVTATIAGTITATHTLDGARPVTATAAGTLALVTSAAGSLPVTAIIAGSIEVVGPVVALTQTDVSARLAGDGPVAAARLAADGPIVIRAARITS